MFRRGTGEGSDVVGKEMYEFEDKGGRALALRPEGTAPIVRAWVQHRPPLPWKAWYATPAFRYERPQAGRYRQHHQVGVEALGHRRRRPRRRGDRPGRPVLPCPRARHATACASTPWATTTAGPPTSSCCATTWRAPRDELCPEHRERAAGQPAAGARLQARRLPGRHRRRPDAGRPPVRAVPRRTWPGCWAGLDALGVPYDRRPPAGPGVRLLHPDDVRVLLRRPRVGPERHRRGRPLRRHGGDCSAARPRRASASAWASSGSCWPATPRACSRSTPRRSTPSWSTPTGGTAARDLTAALRDAGLSADRAFDDRSMKAQFKAADRSGARWVLIVGPDEAASGTVSLRPLRGDGDQRTVPVDGGGRRASAAADPRRRQPPDRPVTGTPTHDHGPRLRRGHPKGPSSDRSPRAQPTSSGATSMRTDHVRDAAGRRRRAHGDRVRLGGEAPRARRAPGLPRRARPHRHRPVRGAGHRRRPFRVRGGRGGHRAASARRGPVNPELPTGEVELADCTVTLLNAAEPPPFAVDDRVDVDEVIRLKHRFVDLRRPTMQANLRLRAKVNGGPAGGHGPPGLRRGGDAAAVGADPRGGPGVRRAQPAPPRRRATCSPRARSWPSSC